LMKSAFHLPEKVVTIMGAQPNILMIMVDSLRPDRLGCGGNPSALTPNMDALASSGAFMSQNFCPMPSSAPSRASIFTGRFPHAHGVEINDLPLPETEVTLPELLQEAGYLTAGTPELDPGLDRGFEEIFPAPKEARQPGDAETVEELSYPTTLIADGTVDWLSRNAGNDPWFIWVDESIHEPWRPPQPYRSLFDPEYDGEGVSKLMMYHPDMEEKEKRHLLALYDGEAALMDKNIGRILGSLDDAGIRRETMVLLVSDHGVFLGEHDFFKKPPFLFDPLIRTTLIIAWPERIPPIRVSSLTHIVDVMPTVLDLVGLPIPERTHGKSIRPLFSDGERILHPAVFTEFCPYKGTEAAAVRTQRWKYIHNHSVGHIPWSGDYSPGEVFEEAGLEREMLFDLSEDPLESRNLLEEKPEVAGRMKSLLLDWLMETRDAAAR